LLFHTLVAVADVWAPFESEGTVFGSIDKKQLAGLAVPRFDPMTARGLESVLARLDNRVGLAFVETEALAQLRDTLLPGLMSGEIRVREAERAVEQAT
jgi:type I restriction enzyme S subunit